MARRAKKLGWSRNKASRAAPIEPRLHKIFMDEYDRYQPRITK
jgi:hypothetical protein